MSTGTILEAKFLGSFLYWAKHSPKTRLNECYRRHTMIEWQCSNRQSPFQCRESALNRTVGEGFPSHPTDPALPVSFRFAQAGLKFPGSLQQKALYRCSVSLFRHLSSPIRLEPRVFIDGNKLGVAPVVTNLMKRDASRTVTVKLPGYKTFEKQFEPDGKPIPLGLTLEKE
jgi:hypothetical protein